MHLSDKPALADTAHVLSDQLRAQLLHLSNLIAPHAAALEKKFLARLRKLGRDRRESESLVMLTFGSAARLLAGGAPPARFFEQVSAAGRRLARINVPPASVLEALEEYAALLEPLLAKRKDTIDENARWAREQLHFCIVLSLNNAYYQVRESETHALQRILSLELETRDLGELYASFIHALSEVCHAAAANLFVLEKEGTTARLAASWPPRQSPLPERKLAAAERRKFSLPCHLAGKPDAPLILERGWKRGFRSVWSVPLSQEGKLAGIMQFAFAEPTEWLPRDLEMLTAAAERCRRAADRARLLRDLADRETQLKALADHMLQVEEMERRRISRELHDDAGQSLVCIRLQLELTEGDIPEELVEVRRNLAEIRNLTEKTILDIRRLISDLSPAVLEQLGLGAAVRQLVNRFRKAYPCQVRLHVGRLPDVPQKVQIVTYRLLQECCNNVARHSSASNVNISVTAADRVLKLIVRDDGTGFEVEEALARHKSLGLAGMRERVALLGGRFELKSERPPAKNRSRGTQILIELPIPLEESALPE